ncbi:MAG: phosphatase PAP2 family protein [Pedobacter sp.]|nr:phosphatase PAP2 family protein [Pedobacter sp.]MDQ8053720.1 phosphatase PAP2 family protein [Pedobacter sp.]
MIAEIQQFDTALFLKIHRGLGNDFFDVLMPLLRNRFFWAPLYLFIIVFCIRQFQKKGYYMIGMLLATFAMGDLIASRIIKPLVGRIRPCNEVSLVHDIIQRVPCGSGFSFPSSHATNHFAIAIFLICLFYRQWKPILPLGLAWALLISFAQIYVGVHYPVDTLVGALLGTCIGFSTFAIYQKIKPA